MSNQAEIERLLKDLAQAYKLFLFFRSQPIPDNDAIANAEQDIERCKARLLQLGVPVDVLLPHVDSSDIRQYIQMIQGLAQVGVVIAGNNDAPISVQMGNNFKWSQFLEIPYTEWRTKQNIRLNKLFHHKNDSHAYFGQILNVADKSIRLIARPQIWANLDAWFQNFESNHQAMVVLGEEGDGKTWSVASWLQRKIEHDVTCPAVVFLSSINVTSNSVSQLLSEAIFPHFSEKLSPEFSKLSSLEKENLISTWIERSTSSIPSILLVLDGINERGTFDWWRDLLSELQNSVWEKHIALIVTCRKAYWERYFSGLNFLNVSAYTLLPYDDQELNIALSIHGLQHTDIPFELLQLAKKPRYFDLFIRHRERLAESGDPTIARLMYEDWRDRLNRKSTISLDDTSFQNLLRELVDHHLTGKKVGDHELKNLLPPTNKEMQLIEELRTGGVLSEKRGKYVVQENHLVLALGLVLVDQIEDAVEDGNDVYEVIAEWLEPHPAMDIKALICEHAVVWALYSSTLPASAKSALLYAWMTSQNIGIQGLERFDSYFPRDRQSYFELAEHIWTQKNDHGWGQRVLMKTFLRWILQEQDTQQEIWQRQFTYWLGFTHRSFYPVLGEKGEEQIINLRKQMTERLGFELPLGPFTFAGYELTVIEDDGLIRLARVALTLISHIPRQPYVRALVTGCLAGVLMGHEDRYDEFAWIFRSSQQSLWEFVRTEVEMLLAENKHLALQAAYRLLSYIGNKEAFQLQQTLPDNLFPQPDWLKQRLKDPCTAGFSWRRKDCEECIGREDLKPDWLARQIAPYCIDPDLSAPPNLGERLASIVTIIDVQNMHSGKFSSSDDLAYKQYESALCAYTPTTIAELIHCLVQDLARREGWSLRILSLSLAEYSLIFTSVEEEIIVQVWQRLNMQDHLTEDQEIAECFLFKEVLKQHNGEEQLRLLISRSKSFKDLSYYAEYFRSIEKWQYVWQILRDIRDDVLLQRFLWFIAKDAATISDEDIVSYILPIVYETRDSFVRAMALRVIYESHSFQTITEILKTWSWNKAFHNQENTWGSLILAEYGDSLPFSSIMERVHPIYLDYAIVKRGSRTNEVQAYALILHHYWSQLGLQILEPPTDLPLMFIEDSPKGAKEVYSNRWSLSDLNLSSSIGSTAMSSSWGGDIDTAVSTFEDIFGDNFEKRQQAILDRINEIARQQWELGNHWFLRRLHSPTLEKVMDIHFDLVEQWLSSALSTNSANHAELRAGSTFYETLCIALLRKKPLQGIMLYRHLQNVPMYAFTRDGLTRLRFLDQELFQIPFTPESEQIWNSKLSAVKTDQELLELVLLVQSDGARDWLQSLINRGLNSDAPFAYMQAISLLGFMDDQNSRKKLTELQGETPDTWMRKLVQTPILRQQHNAWAKHWFQRFLTEPDKQRAWAAFRLFLRCVDRRFWFWQSKIIEDIGSDKIDARRLEFINHNRDDIQNRIDKNEQELGKLFLGQKALENKVWPWVKI